jgi:hypothetical protein
MNSNPSTNLKPENDIPFAPSSWTSPRLDDEANRFPGPRFSVAADEVLVVDGRSGLSPSQAVEDRLIALLRDSSLPMSHLQIRGVVRGRRNDHRDY